MQVLKGRALARKAKRIRCKKIKVKINTLFYSFDLIVFLDLQDKIWGVLIQVGALPFQPRLYFPIVNKILQLGLLDTQGHTRARLSACTIHIIAQLEFLPLSLITSQQSCDLSPQDSQTVQFAHES